MTSYREIICTGCEHFHGILSGYACDAFPKGIPESIWETNVHAVPIKGQKNKFVYKKKTEPDYRPVNSGS